MVRTRVGYAGGTTKNPTYYSIGDHTESFQVDFDPQQITYEKLLKLFWASHNPCASAGSRQYMTAVFYQNDAQKKLAEQTRAEQAAKREQKIKTEIAPLTVFYLAEDYHQKFYLRQQKDLLAEFEAIYPKVQDLYNSTAVARVNGYLGGNGSSLSLQKELDSYGLSAAARAKLLKLTKGLK